MDCLSVQTQFCGWGDNANFLTRVKLCKYSPKSSNISLEGLNLKIKSHLIYIKRNVSCDFPGSNDDLLVVAELNPLLHKFEYFEYLSDFFFMIF